jgi:hypothetical protein
VLRALFDASLFRLLLPRFLDGGEVDPLTFVQVIEEDRPARRERGVVPLPGRGLLHDRGLPRAGGGARHLRR